MNTWPEPAQPIPLNPGTPGAPDGARFTYEIVQGDSTVQTITFLGHCYICALAASQNAGSEVKSATMLVKGTGVCNDHLTYVANADLLSRLPY